LRDVQVEPLGEGHLVLNFVIAATLLGVRTPHDETAWRHPDALHAEAVGEDLRRLVGDDRHEYCEQNETSDALHGLKP
jgi:hypothetical protein